MEPDKSLEAWEDVYFIVYSPVGALYHSPDKKTLCVTADAWNISLLQRDGLLQ